MRVNSAKAAPNSAAGRASQRRGSVQSLNSCRSGGVLIHAAPEKPRGSGSARTVGSSMFSHSASGLPGVGFPARRNVVMKSGRRGTIASRFESNAIAATCPAATKKIVVHHRTRDQPNGSEATALIGRRSPVPAPSADVLRRGSPSSRPRAPGSPGERLCRKEQSCQPSAPAPPVPRRRGRPGATP